MLRLLVLLPLVAALIVDTPDVRGRIASDGGDPMPSMPEEYTADIEREDKKWGALIRKLGLKVE